MLAPPAAVPSSWRRCNALLVVADGIGQALQGPANEMQAGKSQCRATAGCPMLAGRALLDWLFSLLPSGSSACPLPLMAHALSTGGKEKEEESAANHVLLGRAMNPAAAYRAAWLALRCFESQTERQGWLGVRANASE
ncbi:uncharacterized protein TrAtP1_012494 [Trichoderma atroviride]|uniref:uncharacterized protein n=1 Tax=Hypocrea atroviridis TaxID=63577 RepID=UPI00332FD0CF|nr:hypothetical protein TrAtP1_012494 [Trichoderma atroviride]